MVWRTSREYWHKLMLYLTNSKGINRIFTGFSVCVYDNLFIEKFDDKDLLGMRQIETNDDEIKMRFTVVLRVSRCKLPFSAPK